MIPAWTLAMMEETGPAFSPLDLGSKLKAWWAPPVSEDNVTLSGSAISSWTDEVGGYDLSQATAANRPTYDASSFGGLACAEFDGSNDYLELAPVPAGIPTGSSHSEMWLSCRQDALTADTGNRIPFSIGLGSSVRRQVARLVDGGVNKAVSASSGAISGGVGDFSGVHVVRGIFAATVQTELDGSADTASGSATHNTATTRVVMGTNAGLSATYWDGAIRQVVITDLLSAGEAAQLRAFLDQGL